MSILKAAQAARQASPKALPADAPQVCIDLPGETIRCYVHKPKVQIIWRKHRDVIFDIEPFKVMQYTVEAGQSDFCNARDIKAAWRDTRRLAHQIDRPGLPVLRREAELHIDSFAK